MLQVKERKTPLAAVQSLVMAYADSWRPGGFPVPVEEEVDTSQTGDSAARTAATLKQQAVPPQPFLLHRAVWAQAEILAKRCQLLSRVGENLSTEIRRQADLVRKHIFNARRNSSRPRVCAPSTVTCPAQISHRVCPPPVSQNAAPPLETR